MAAPKWPSPRNNFDSNLVYINEIHKKNSLCVDAPIATFIKIGCFPATDMQTPPPPPPPQKSPSRHKDAQCTTKLTGVRFHITSSRVWALRPFKRGVFGAQKFNFLQNWPNLQGRLELVCIVTGPEDLLVMYAFHGGYYPSCEVITECSQTKCVVPLFRCITWKLSLHTFKSNFNTCSTNQNQIVFTFTILLAY